MPTGHKFEYLSLILRKQGPARFPSGPRDEDPNTLNNKAHPQVHAGGLRTPTTSASTNWKERQVEREKKGLPNTDVGIPLLLKIDPSLELDDLRRQFSFEIISEYHDGFVIVASEDVNLALFQTKLTDFVGTVIGWTVVNVFG